jgi:hypothetical protein
MRMSDAMQGEVFAAVALLVVVSLLTFVGRRKRLVVTAERTTYEKTTRAEDGTETTAAVTLLRGDIVPKADQEVVTLADVRAKTFSAMRLLVVGKDGRTSTSKSVAFAWTLAILFALLAILFAKWCGDKVGYATLKENGLREEYWLLLGGPYAAAILAKYATTSQAEGGSKTDTTGGANVQQLVVNDEGEGDLGDFQYVAFNVVALLFFLGAFIPSLDSGIPELPKVLTGLALTSAGAYSAKKFLAQAKPTLLSLLPTSVAASTDTAKSTFELWGNDLILPGSVTASGSAEPPKVLINGVLATVTAFSQTIGADRITVQLPVGVAGAELKVVAVRADGAPATGPGGIDSLSLTVT